MGRKTSPCTTLGSLVFVISRDRVAKCSSPIGNSGIDESSHIQSTRGDDIHVNPRTAFTQKETTPKCQLSTLQAQTTKTRLTTRRPRTTSDKAPASTRRPPRPAKPK